MGSPAHRRWAGGRVTCVVGVVDPGVGVTLGADSCSGGGDASTSILTPKLYKLSPFVAFGFTTSWRFGQILGHHLQINAGCPPDPFEWVVAEFVKAMREALDEHGHLKKENSREEGGSLLVAVADRLFGVVDDFGVVEYGQVDACGDGFAAATGAMRAAKKISPEMEATEVAKIGLIVAAQTRAYVRAPFNYETTVVDVT
jgi:hypothetical protein